MKKVVAILLVLLMLLSSVGGIAFAQSDSESNQSETRIETAEEDDTNTTEAEDEEATEANQEADFNALSERLQASRIEANERRSDRRDSSKLKHKNPRCEARAIKLNNIMDRFVLITERHLAVFDTINSRVETFYSMRQLEVANYNELTADVSAKKSLAQEAINLLRTNRQEFDCSGQDPKAPIHSFKDNLHATLDALKAYRTSIKNLIVAVKTSIGEGESNE